MKKLLLVSLGLMMAVRLSAQTFSLQLLHSSDMEAGLSAIKNAPHFAALVDTFTRQRPNNTLLLSGGDNYLPSPFFNAASDPSYASTLRAVAGQFYSSSPTTATASLGVGIGRADIMVMNILGFRASAVGNHEFDAGPNDFRGIISTSVASGNPTWIGAQFPYLSANLVYTTEPNLTAAYTSAIKIDTNYNIRPERIATADAERRRKIAPATICIVNGERIGVVGVTTQIVPTISSTGGVRVLGGVANNMDTLAKYTQPWVDSLVARGINKIVLLSHLQQINFEKQLLPKLRNVDIIIAAGSHTLMADRNDVLRAGDVLGDRYPYSGTDRDGKTTLLLSTTSEWSYLGRLNVDFNAAGEVLPTSLDSTRNGAYAADSAGVVRQVGAANYSRFMTGSTKAGLVAQLTSGLATIIGAQDGNLFGRTDVYLEGRREFVRTQETNLGNLSADANLWYARRADPTVRVSIKNGGGIRTAIGAIEVNGATNEYVLLPPTANPGAGKRSGDISQLDIMNSLRFNNALTLVTVSAGRLARLLNHGVAAWTASATPGQFPQVGGLRFSFDPTLAAGSRIRNAALVDSSGVVVDTLIRNGVLRGDTTRAIRVVTLNFLAGGGDSYPFPQGATANVVNMLATTPVFTGGAIFVADGTEQDAFAEYCKTRFTTTPFNVSETATTADTRIQNLTFRPDGVFGTNVATATAKAPNLVLAPNPATSSVRVMGSHLGAGRATVRVVDMMGRTVAMQYADAQGNSFDATVATDKLQAGVYTLVVTVGNHRAASRLVVK